MNEREVREAIKYLKSKIRAHKKTIEALPNSAQKKSPLNQEIKILKTALEALKKQLPEQVAIMDTGFQGYCCPDCKSWCGQVLKYCPECGQALNWTKEMKQNC